MSYMGWMRKRLGLLRPHNVELPSWLKIESLIGHLNLSGWFRRENNIQIDITFNDFHLAIPLDPNGSPERVVVDAPPLQEKINTGEINEVFSDDQKMLIERINEIHKAHGSNYSFENSYRSALEHIKRKSPPDWFITAAAHIANAIQSGDKKLGIEIFFASFQEIDDPEKADKFALLKDKIGYCYKRVQNMRHVDKSGELEEHMTTEYQRTILGKGTILDSDYEKIFSDFQNLLLELFRDFHIKIL